MRDHVSPSRLSTQKDTSEINVEFFLPFFFTEVLWTYDLQNSSIVESKVEAAKLIRSSMHERVNVTLASHVCANSNRTSPLCANLRCYSLSGFTIDITDSNGCPGFSKATSHS